jgi:hypothetical protein
MTRLLALFAFLVLAGFLAILAFEVPSPDLVLVALLTVALVAWDFLSSANKQ